MGDFHEEWYVRLKFPGRAEVLKNSGYDICAKCMALGNAVELRTREGCGCCSPGDAVKTSGVSSFEESRLL